MSALLLWLGLCPTCENPVLSSVPGIRQLPLIGTLVAASALLCFWLGNRAERAKEMVAANRVWTALWPVLSLLLVVANVLVAAFATVAIKPCLFCSVFWVSLAVACLLAAFMKLPGGWVAYVAVAVAFPSTYLIVATPFQFTVSGFVAPMLSHLGLSPGAAWPTSLNIQGVETFIVLGQCAPCNAKSGQAAIDLVFQQDGRRAAVLFLADRQAKVHVPEGMRAREIAPSQFQALNLMTDSPPFVFQVKGHRVVSAGPAANALAQLRAKGTTVP